MCKKINKISLAHINTSKLDFECGFGHIVVCGADFVVVFVEEVVCLWFFKVCLVVSVFSLQCC